MSLSRTVRLADVVDFQTGFPFKSASYSETGVRLLRGDNIGQGILRWDGAKFWPADMSDDVAEYALQAGDVVLAMDRPWIEAGLKRAAVGRDDLPAFLVQRVARLRETVALTAGYLRYLIGSPAFLEHVLNITTGTAVPHINGRGILEFEFNLPPLDEQREIAAILGALDDKIEVNRRTAATLEAMARALYRSWFVDFDPVRARAEGRPPAFMDPATAALFPDRLTDDGLPEGWSKVRLGDLLTLNYGKALRRDTRRPGRFPVYGPGGADSTHEEALVADPTIIVGRKGTVGSLHWAPHGCWPIDTVFFVTSAYSLAYILRTLEHLPLSEMNTDAAVPGLNRENAYRLEVVCPKDTVLEAFSSLAAPWQHAIDQLDVQNQTLATLRDTLLPRLMSGDLRVGAAEALVGEVA